MASQRIPPDCSLRAEGRECECSGGDLTSSVYRCVDRYTRDGIRPVKSRAEVFYLRVGYVNRKTCPRVEKAKDRPSAKCSPLPATPEQRRDVVSGKERHNVTNIKIGWPPTKTEIRIHKVPPA